MATADRAEIARVLREIGSLLEIKGENPFKTRAYATAASRLEGLSDDQFATMADRGALIELPGIGEAIAEKIATLRRTGRLPYHDELRAQFPPGLSELIGLPELGPKRIAALHAALGIRSLDDLAAACRAGRVRTVRGFSEGLEARLLEATAARRREGVQRPIGSARPIALELKAALERVAGVRRAEVAGAVRRFAELVATVRLAAAADAPEAALGELSRLPMVAQSERDGSAAHVLLRDGTHARVAVSALEGFAGLWLLETGSAAHLRRLEERARQLGLGALESIATECHSEADLYAALGLPFIAPELREDAGEVEAAIAGTLPALVEPRDVAGVVHAHTRSSDGRDDLVSMARAARALGMTYLTVTDHSRSAGYAGGLSIDELDAQADAVAEAQEAVPGVALLRGAEVDILEDGRLDYPDRVLERLDIVIASVHSRFKQDEEQMTRRILKALDNPHLDVLAHPTGRLIARRPPFAVRMGEVLDKAAARGVTVEVNGNLARLDLSAAHVKEALARGVRLVVSADAHSCAELANVFHSVATARRGWARGEDVLNTLPVEAFKRELRARRR